MASLVSLLKKLNQVEVSGHELVNDRVYLRTARIDDYQNWSNLRETSRIHLTQWEPDWDDACATRENYIKRLKADRLHIAARRRLPLFIFDIDSHELMGMVTLFHMQLGNRCSASIGYWLGKDYIGNGYAQMAVEAVTDYSFSHLGMMRIEAACQPENVASRNLLERSGFQLEGLARAYLKINGRWRDHEFWALLYENP